MSELHDKFPNADDLLALTPDALAPILLRIAANARQGGGMFVPSSILTATFGSGMTAERGPIYPHHKNQQVERLAGQGGRISSSCGRVVSNIANALL
jgi:hypothetical protein